MSDHDDDRLTRELRDLPRSIEPPRDLWPAIAPRLAPRRRVPHWLPLAAAIALLVGGPSAVWVARHAAMPATPVSVARDDGTADDLLAALEHDPGALAPETIAALRRNLAVIDSAIAESRRALARDAADASAERWLRAVQRQRLDLLRQVVRLPRS